MSKRSVFWWLGCAALICAIPLTWYGISSWRDHIEYLQIMEQVERDVEQEAEEERHDEAMRLERERIRAIQLQTLEISQMREEAKMQARQERREAELQRQRDAVEAATVRSRSIPPEHHAPIVIYEVYEEPLTPLEQYEQMRSSGMLRYEEMLEDIQDDIRRMER